MPLATPLRRRTARRRRRPSRARAWNFRPQWTRRSLWRCKSRSATLASPSHSRPPSPSSRPAHPALGAAGRAGSVDGRAPEIIVRPPCFRHAPCAERERSGRPATAGACPWRERARPLARRRSWLELIISTSVGADALSGSPRPRGQPASPEGARRPGGQVPQALAMPSARAALEALLDGGGADCSPDPVPACCKPPAARPHERSAP